MLPDFGSEGQRKLKNSTVVVIGAGIAVGSRDVSSWFKIVRFVKLGLMVLRISTAITLRLKRFLLGSITYSGKRLFQERELHMKDFVR